MEPYIYPTTKRAVETLPFIEAIVQGLMPGALLNASEKLNAYANTLCFDIFDDGDEQIAELALSYERSLGWNTLVGEAALRREIAAQLGL